MRQIFASSDKDEGSFRSYYDSMPWMALPYKQRSLKEKLAKRFDVTVRALKEMTG